MANANETQDTVHYEGIFVSQEAVNAALDAYGISDRLDREIAMPHVTCAYKPTDPRYDLVGKPVELQIVGYGNDGKNEGFLVDVSDKDADIHEMSLYNDQPHITISVAQGARPVDTVRLDFEPIEPIILRGVYGYMDGTNQLVTGGQPLPTNIVRENMIPKRYTADWNKSAEPASVTDINKGLIADDDSFTGGRGSDFGIDI